MGPAEDFQQACQAKLNSTAELWFWTWTGWPGNKQEWGQRDLEGSGVARPG